MTVCEESRPFVVDRNIRHFVWYGGVAGEGLRSDGVDDLPLSKSVCSILPIARHLRAGVSRTSHPALRVARDLEWCHHDYPRWGGHNPSSRARHTGFSHRVGAPTTPRAGFRPFVANRNICNFMWYGGVERGVAGVGLRSVGEEALPSSKSVCSILPIVRHLRAGVSRTFHPDLRSAPVLCRRARLRRPS